MSNRGMFVKEPFGIPATLPISDDADPKAVTSSIRRGKCIDCNGFVRVNDTDDRFWPFVGEDDSLICNNNWGHRVPREVAEWLTEGTGIEA